ncbi:hypothetical protein TSAR_002293 [Trichomalopsis sarcophagae]|uniref:Alcohol dehydrogenase-like C-terminal domain-containing protein n=1 Tax=Trichomalopsis sarcophagae TaxID=543379 RepID=A0A232F255_9HYME|nr:hypothetical protein TSAR_002293 [Trichomalopsis sarcophagae]
MDIKVLGSNPDQRIKCTDVLITLRYSDALDLVSTKNINLGTIVTHRYKFEETLQAFDTAKSTHSGAIKFVLVTNCRTGVRYGALILN